MAGQSERGVATVVALLAMVLMSVIGAALVLNSASEFTIAARFANAQEGRYAAEAVLERVIDELGGVSDWDVVLGGSSPSGFVDGAPSGVRVLPGGVTLDLASALNLINCGKAAPCTPAELAASTAARPWGSNNPVWVWYAFGPLSSMLPGPTINSPYYVTVMVADDPAEDDGNPRRDGGDPKNPGAGVLELRGEAFGPSGVHATVEATVARSGKVGLRVLSWREIS